MRITNKAVVTALTSKVKALTGRLARARNQQARWAVELACVEEELRAAQTHLDTLTALEGGAR